MQGAKRGAGAAVLTSLLLTFSGFVVGGEKSSHDNQGVEFPAAFRQKARSEITLKPGAKMPVVVIKDSKGDVTRITNLRLYIIRGRYKAYERSFVLKKGDSELLIDFDMIACVMKATENGDWTVILKNKEKVSGKLREGSGRQYLMGKALFGDAKLDYLLPLERLEWGVQVEPPVPGISVKDGEVVIEK